MGVGRQWWHFVQVAAMDCRQSSDSVPQHGYHHLWVFRIEIIPLRAPDDHSLTSLWLLLRKAMVSRDRQLVRELFEWSHL
jgi:hypothetical protein